MRSKIFFLLRSLEAFFGSFAKLELLLYFDSGGKQEKYKTSSAKEPRFSKWTFVVLLCSLYCFGKDLNLCENTTLYAVLISLL